MKTNHSVEVYCIKAGIVGQTGTAFFALAFTLYKNDKAKVRVVSFFAGCGGLDLGFEQAGFDVIWANEFEPHCRATYVRNHPNTEFVLGDVRKIDPNTIPDCDGFIGGPPCQSWSVGGKMRGLDDERGQLFLKYIDLIKATKVFRDRERKGYAGQ